MMNAFIWQKRKDKMTSVRSLAEYIQNEEKRSHSADCRESEFFLNMSVANKEEAISVMENTVKQSKRAKFPLHHFGLTFPRHESNDETLSTEKLQKITKEVLNDIGYEDHQAICSIHYDTNNYHVHISLCKIKYNAELDKYESRNPQMLKERLSKAARTAELKHGLSHDNGIYKVVRDKNNKPQIVKDDKYSKENKENRQSTLSRAASSKEAHSQIKSFESYLKEDVNPGMTQFHIANKANNGGWQEFHGELAKYNLTAQKSGGGLKLFDITEQQKNPDVKGTAISKMGRYFALGKLENDYGKFEPSIINYSQNKPVYKYNNEAPVGSKANSPKKVDSLREVFLKEIKQNQQEIIKPRNKEKREINAKYKNLKNNHYKSVTAEKKAEWKNTKDRMGVKYLPADSKENKQLRSFYAAKRLKGQEELDRQKQQEMKALKEKYPDVKYTRNEQYRQFVEDHAQDPSSEHHLQAKNRLTHWESTGKAAQDNDRNQIINKSQYQGVNIDEFLNKNFETFRNVDCEFRDTEIVYKRSGEEIFIDKGNSIEFTGENNNTDDDFEAGLKLAAAQYNNRVEITGNDPFKEKMYEISLQYNHIEILNEDFPEWRRQHLQEQKRQQALEQQKTEPVQPKTVDTKEFVVQHNKWHTDTAEREQARQELDRDDDLDREL